MSTRAHHIDWFIRPACFFAIVSGAYVFGNLNAAAPFVGVAASIQLGSFQ